MVAAGSEMVLLGVLVMLISGTLLPAAKPICRPSLSLKMLLPALVCRVEPPTKVRRYLLEPAFL